MLARLLYVLLAGGGIAALVWGVPAAHRLQKPRDSFAALAALIGLLLALVGILGIIIPDFFRTS